MQLVATVGSARQEQIRLMLPAAIEKQASFPDTWIPPAWGTGNPAVIRLAKRPRPRPAGRYRLPGVAADGA